MRNRIMLYSVVLLVSGFTGSIFAGTEGPYNVFYGNGAGTSNTTGIGNTFVGLNAGYSNTIGYSNSFLGGDAGHSNATGLHNSFLGYRSGYSNIEGSFNTFVGSFAGQYSTASDNTFIGQSAGNFNTGFANSFLGAQAGFLNTGNSNVFLGYHAGYNETGSDRLYIANSSTSSPLIYGEFDDNLLVINGVLSIASSREYKERIDPLKPEKAIDTLQRLNPVEFSYKTTPSGRHMGFISEEVPDALTAKERKAVSPMDIVAVLTKVVQEQQKMISTLREELNELKGRTK